MIKLKDRIKLLRKDLGLTQQNFAIKLGLKRQTIAAYESGKIEPSESTLLLMCKEFNVNEQWLQTGKGEMKRKVNEEERYTLNLENLGKTDNETIIRWVNAIAETNPEVLKEVERFMKKIIGIDEDAQVFEYTAPGRTIDEELEICRYELEAEEKKQGKGA